MKTIDTINYSPEISSNVTMSKSPLFRYIVCQPSSAKQFIRASAMFRVERQIFFSANSSTKQIEWKASTKLIKSINPNHKIRKRSVKRHFLFEFNGKCRVYQPLGHTRRINDGAYMDLIKLMAFHKRNCFDIGWNNVLYIHSIKCWWSFTASRVDLEVWSSEEVAIFDVRNRIGHHYKFDWNIFMDEWN